jgi:hypothetical protein
MPPPYRKPHYSVFAAIPHTPQGSVGYVPATWAMNHKLPSVPNVAGLPHHKLDRAQVRAICRNPAHHVLFGYVCAMAWGLQGAGPGGRGHVASAWAARNNLIPKLNTLRVGGLTRITAYNLFTGANAISGLGPSYFTKLLYFFSPQPTFYIMDQWTGKSVDLLTGNWIVRMAGTAPSSLNKSGNYQACCEEIDSLAGLLGNTGEQIEERMFSKGKPHPWPWRSHVDANWLAHKPHHRYHAAGSHAIYPHIPITDF